jgi:TnpA family transposase
MLGRAVKTTYILRYLHDGALRDRVHLQLNCGESRHELARRLFFYRFRSKNVSVAS